MAAERMSGFEQRLVLIETMMADAKTQFANVQDTTNGLGDGLQQVTADLQKYATGLANEKAEFMRNLNAELDDHKLALAAVVNGARDEFAVMKGALTDLHGHTAQAFGDVKAKVEKLEADVQKANLGKGPGSAATTHGFLPMKSLVPAVFGSSEEHWRGWQDDVADYLDSQKPGMKGLLKTAEKEIGQLDEAWVREQGLVNNVNAGGEQANVYRALKALTSGEAKTVVQGVRGENGYAAWRALHQRFGPSVAARQGRVMCDLSQMVSKPAKTPAETRTLVTELERRIRIAEDITGDSLGDGHIKSILASILDPTTRAHTSAYQGVSTTYQELKRAVLEFANNTVANRADAPEPMNIGKCSESQEHQRQPMWADTVTEAAEETWELVGDLAAVSPHTQCFQCGGYGHLAQACPTPKGKGKGLKGGPKGGKGDAPKGGLKGAKGFKGGPKGGGKKGPAGGCWTCGGQHFAAECPAWSNHGGKGGKVGKGFNAVEQFWPEPTVTRLCTLGVSRIAQPGKSMKPSKPAMTMANSFEALSSEDEDEAEEKPTMRKLGDFVSQAMQRQPKKQHKRQKPQKQPAVGGRVCPLATIEPEGLNSATHAPQWEVVEFAVDSGASETVIPENAVMAAPLQPSEASKRGVQYEVANGHRIPNLGQKTFQGVTETEDLIRGVTAQVCDVNKPLLSVARLVKSGNTVVFSGDGSYVEDDSTKERMWLQESGGMFMLKLWVPAEAQKTGF